MLKISFFPKTGSRSLDLYRIVSKSSKSSPTGSVLAQIGTFSIKNNLGHRQAQMSINSESFAKQAYFGAKLTKSAIRAFSLLDKTDSLQISEVNYAKSVFNVRRLCVRPSIHTVKDKDKLDFPEPHISSNDNKLSSKKSHQQIEFEKYIVNRSNFVYFRNFYADVALRKGYNVNYVSDRWSYSKKYLYGFFSGGNLWFYYSAHIIFLSTILFFIVIALLFYNQGDIIQYFGMESFFNRSDFYIDLPCETNIYTDIMLRLNRNMYFIVIDKITFKPVNSVSGYEVLFDISKYNLIDDNNFLQSSRRISFNQFKDFGIDLDTFFKAGITNDRDLVNQIMSTFKSKKLTIDCVSLQDPNKSQSLKSISATFDILSSFGVKISEMTNFFEFDDLDTSKTFTDNQNVIISQFLIEDVIETNSYRHGFLKDYEFGNTSYLLLLIKRRKFLFYDLHSYVKASRSMNLQKNCPNFVFIPRLNRIPGYNKRMFTKHFFFRNSDKYGRPNSKSKYGGLLERLQFMRTYTRLTGIRKSSDTQKRFWYSGWKSHFLKDREAKFSLKTSKNEEYLKFFKINIYTFRKAFKQFSEDIKLKNTKSVPINATFFDSIISLVDRLASGLSWNVNVDPLFLRRRPKDKD
jgi:ribosomal protein S16